MRLGKLALVGSLLLVAACGGPSYVRCKGEGSVTATTQVMIYSGTANINAKCGDGFEYEERTYRPKEKAATK